MSKRDPRITFQIGAARKYCEDRFGGPCAEFESPGIGPISANGQVLINGNGDRVGLVFINIGPNTVAISVALQAGGTTGIVLSAGAAVSMNVNDDLTLPTRQWFASSTAGNSFIYVLEMFRVSLAESVGT